MENYLNPFVRSWFCLNVLDPYSGLSVPSSRPIS